MKEFLVPQIAGPTVATTTGVIATINMPPLDHPIGSPALPGYVQISVELGKEVFLKPFSSQGGAAPAAGVLMHFSDSMNGLILNVKGCDRVRVLEKTAAAILYITPLGNT